MVAEAGHQDRAVEGASFEPVTSDDVAARLRALLHAFDLPLGAPALDHSAVLTAMRLDKKVSGGRMRFVLLEGIGRPVLRDDVEPGLVEDVVRGLVAN